MAFPSLLHLRPGTANLRLLLVFLLSGGTGLWGDAILAADSAEKSRLVVQSNEPTLYCPGEATISVTRSKSLSSGGQDDTDDRYHGFWFLASAIQPALVRGLPPRPRSASLGIVRLPISHQPNLPRAPPTA